MFCVVLSVWLSIISFCVLKKNLVIRLFTSARRISILFGKRALGYVRYNYVCVCVECFSCLLCFVIVFCFVFVCIRVIFFI